MAKPSNFRFLSPWREIMNKALRAEEKVFQEPRTSLIYARMTLELAVKWMYSHDADLEKPYDNSLNSLMKQQDFRDQINRKLYQEIDLIRKAGNMAAHGNRVSSRDSRTVIEYLYYFMRWFSRSYNEEDYESIGRLDESLIPRKEEETVSRNALEKLQQKLEQQIRAFEKLEEDERQKREALRQENELFREQLKRQQEKMSAGKSAANAMEEVKHPRNEAETRRYFIDVALREAGWDTTAPDTTEYEVTGMPRSVNKSGVGYVDYVLWDDDGLPLAVVEAKRTMVNAEKGENQAQLYAEALEKKFGRRPVMFYSNGFEIYIWDDCFYKSARPVSGFYTKRELQTLMYRRQNRQDIRQLPIDTEIAGRPYQMRAIRSITEHFAGSDKRTGDLIGTSRGALLVLATGTGKTRTSIAFSKLMFEANWVRRILFLADRVSLVKQAKANFVKLMPEHASVNLIEEKDNPDARIAFSTYQTMMGLIDRNTGEEGRFYGAGHFDLLIIDEAHRSIYQKYKAIFEYFDALLLGLTATPKDNIHHNTYEIFGLPDKTPTDAYSFDEAVAEGYLVPYHVVEAPTRFMTSGIKYKDLTEEEKLKFEDQILDGEPATGEEHIPSEMLDKWLYNKDTARKILQFVLERGIRKRGGDEIGKTIIFARNQQHAHFLRDVFLELDRELYGNEYVKVITHSEPKAQEFIERFCDEEKDRMPQIAISVDMLDTGIDAPSCVNLVFYKPVRSYTKFWQMIGRGSRLRPDLFGPGRDKTHFLIFDLLGNFDFFDQNPQGIETRPQKSISEVVFGLKLQLAEYLKKEMFQEEEKLQQFRSDLLDELYRDVARLDKNRFEVKMRMKIVLDYGGDNRKVWDHLTEKDLHIIEHELAPLIKPSENESDLARFYDRLLYTLMIRRLETPENEVFLKYFERMIGRVNSISHNLLKKMSIPQVKTMEKLISQPLKEDFWRKEGVDHLEKIRVGIRDLVRYVDREAEEVIITDLEDRLDEDEVKYTDYMAADMSSSYDVAFPNNIHRLEKLIRENEDHLTVNRIRNGEVITPEELNSLEAILLGDTLSRQELEKELGRSLDLSRMILRLTGMSAQFVDQAFADFINEHQLNSVQINFLSLIKAFFTKEGRIDPEKLYDPPFRDYHSSGVDGVFDEDQADKIFEIIRKMNEVSGDQSSAG